MDQKKILIIIPAYNESGTIKRTVEEIVSLPLPLDVLVVDDGSSDGTSKEVKGTKAAVVALPFNLGIGGAVQTGFQYACRNGYDLAARMDGDGQHDAAFLEKILEPVIQGQTDIVIGSRFIKPYLGYRSSLIRRLGIHFFAQLLSFLTGTKVTDPTSGFQAYNRQALKVFAGDYPQDFPEPESIIVARRLGLRIQEVPVQMRQREAGSSSIRYLMTLYYMIKVTFAVCLNMIKKRKVIE